MFTTFVPFKNTNKRRISNERIRMEIKDKIVLRKNNRLQQIIFVTIAISCCIPALISPPIALLLGIIIAQTVGHPYLHLNQKVTHILLQASVVGLGFGMQVDKTLETGKTSFLFTLTFLSFTLIIGYLLGKLLKIENKTSFLIAVGTAICGGSAIAAISPVIRVQEKQLSIALGTIFTLNAAALFIFPAVGHALDLSQLQFGIWSAIAIHDASSVVGAANKYGPEALAIATTAKLGRALWIIPVAFLAAYLFKTNGPKVKIPWFIGLFVVAMLANSYIPSIHNYQHIITSFAKTGLTLTLFLIGCGLSRKLIIEMGIKPLLQGIILWVIISLLSLGAVLYFF